MASEIKDDVIAINGNCIKTGTFIQSTAHRHSSSIFGRIVSSVYRKHRVLATIENQPIVEIIVRADIRLRFRKRLTINPEDTVWLMFTPPSLCCTNITAIKSELKNNPAIFQPGRDARAYIKGHINRSTDNYRTACDASQQAERSSVSQGK